LCGVVERFERRLWRWHYKERRREKEEQESEGEGSLDGIEE
jgi:RNA polymerase I-specific transcription initiation factor RRN7